MPGTPPSFTTLVYMMADNSMDSQVDYAVGQLKQGMKSKDVGNTVIYLDRQDASPRLFRISRQGEEIPLKDYPEENSAKAETLVRVIGETKQLVPADHFGLVLWGHATGWLPGGYSHDIMQVSVSSRQNLNTRYMGLDGTPNEATTSPLIEIDALAKSLPQVPVPHRVAHGSTCRSPVRRFGHSLCQGAAFSVRWKGCFGAGLQDLLSPL